MKKSLFKWLILLLGLGSLISCTDEVLTEEGTSDESIMTRGVLPPYFDWANVDYMPTPPGQSLVPSPWSGAGSLSLVYGMDVVNERQPADGWELVYSSFDSNAVGPLRNPYFVLYNKYNGLLRFYLYITTEFISTSSHVKSQLSISSSTYNSSMLNFLAGEVVHSGENPQTYIEVLPSSPNSPPLASGRWYMGEYELAYDPAVGNIPYQNINLIWNLSYSKITQFAFDGTQEGELFGVLGSAEKVNNILQGNSFALEQARAGKGSFSSIGAQMIRNAAISGSKNNTLGLSNGTYSALSGAVNAASNLPIGGIVGSAVKVLNGIFKAGSSGPDNTNYMHGTLSTRISIQGSGTEYGAFPSTPISFWVPGTNIPSTATGQLPLYSAPLGVIGFTGTPEVNLLRAKDYSAHVVINPVVQRIADVNIVEQEVISYYDQKKNHDAYGVRYTIQIRPKDGSKVYRIIKTLYAGPIPDPQEIDIVYMNLGSETSDFNIYIIDELNDIVYELFDYPGSFLLSFGMDTQILLTSDYDSYRRQYGNIGSYEIVSNQYSGRTDFYIPAPEFMPGRYRVIFEYNGRYYAEEVQVGDYVEPIFVDCGGNTFSGRNGRVRGTGRIDDWFF